MDTKQMHEIGLLNVSSLITLLITVPFFRLQIWVKQKCENILRQMRQICGYRTYLVLCQYDVERQTST